ncbi:MAG: BMP family ABC transporter substrate-binding protein [Acidimicrobiales bacterium]
MKNRARFGLVAVLVVAALVAAACGDDGGDSKPADVNTTCTQKAADIKSVDFNGDGKFVVGVATPGPRDDGAYYQALVECVDRLVKANGGSSIIVDKIAQADAGTQIENLAKQNPDILVVGASEIGKPLPDLAKKYSSIFWYCNCGAGQQANPDYAQSQDDGSEINYTAGYATGLLLKDKKKSTAAFIGNTDANGFEVESFDAFNLGLQAVDASYKATYYGTGSFDDVPKATEAYNNAKGAGVGAIYPFLGGAHEPIVKLANKDKLITMSAGKSDACSKKDITYDIAVRFDAGDYLDTIFKEILAGTYKEGSIRTFHVGKDPQPGAKICKPTSDQTKALDAAYADVASGKLDAKFFEIKKKAYKF